MQTFIPLAKPNLLEEDILLAADVLRTGMLVQGKYVQQLENDICSYTGASHASAVSNGTATLHLALLALGIGAGDEVIVPAFSYVATANVVELVGATPIFVDIDLNTYNIRVEGIEAAVTPKTKAILVVHEFGLPCDMDSVMATAKRHNLKVIEDAACALGARYKGAHVGTFGDAGSFSLHPRKAISSGEGGLLVTNDRRIDKFVKVMRNHGMETTDNSMDFTAFGFNYRMTDFQAALVVSQLPRLNANLAVKQKLADLYSQTVNPERVALPSVPVYAQHTWQTYHVLLDAAVDRNQVIEKLRQAGIGVNYGAQCIPYMKAYQQKYRLDCKALFPNALRAYSAGLALPLYEQLTEEQILYVSHQLNQLMS